jgi:two-component system, cell cycle sensor histidine kinase DivJ
MALASQTPLKPIRALLLPLSAHARLRLFRDSRLVATALILALFPALAIGSSEPWTVTAALVLFAAMPVVIALEVRRVAMLDRAVIMSLLCMVAILAGGVLKGMDATAAALLIAVAVMEAIVVSSPRSRRKISALGIACCFGLLAFEMFQMQDSAPAGNLSAMLAAALAVLNVLMLIRGLANAIELEKSNSREQRIIGNEIGDIVSETVVASDANGNVLRVSRNCVRLLGLEPVALLGKGLLELVLVSDRPAFLSAVAGAAGGSPVTARLRLRHTAGSERPSYRWVEMVVRPSLGAAMATVATLRDVDALVAEEDRLNRAAAEAETAKKSQAAFLSTVNHELRTPLNAIIGFSDVLAQPTTMPSDPERVADYARIIRGAGHDLLRMVTSMIDITRLDTGVYDFEPDVQNVAALVDAAVEAYGQDAQSANARFAVTHAVKLREMPVDQRVLRAILQQLLSNAVKFGNGTVDVSTSARNGQFEISVTDHGQGISPDKLAHIGRSFARLDDSLSRERGGLGLGLSLASALARLHGGCLRISSESGKGTTATLCLPAPGEEFPALPTNVTAIPRRSAEGISAPHTLKKARRRHG